jgi:hypothetical protein
MLWTIVDCSAHFFGHPAGVGDRWIDHVGGDPELGKLERCRDRVVLQRGFSRSVGDLLRKPERPPRSQADNATPLRSPLDVTTGELSDT